MLLGFNSKRRETVGPLTNFLALATTADALGAFSARIDAHCAILLLLSVGEVDRWKTKKKGGGATVLPPTTFLEFWNTGKEGDLDGVS